MQGFNMGRYVPPDLEGTTSGNKLHKKHALGQRASKLSSHGILTVRFEMPFPIWCASCPKPTIIGQGVRFNAEKKRAGNYYSTPIWSFRFKHAECGGVIEMRTDPKNTAYVVVSGATKRDTGEDKPREGDVVIMTDQEREALRKSAFASLEKTIEDREQLKQATVRIHDLMDVSARHWDDPYAQNQKLRKAFRAGRKERERLTAATEDLKDRMSLGIDILPETEDDAKRAALVEFGPQDDSSPHDKALSKPLFTTPKAQPNQKTPAGALKSEKEASKRKENLVSELMSNTRASQDPFLLQNARSSESKSSNRLLPGVKRKRLDDGASSSAADGSDQTCPPAKMPAQEPTALSGLVHYDSD